jgi:hypothetical protein
MTSRTFLVGDAVKTNTSLIGRVESFHDWWVMVRMEDSGTVVPYMEPELTPYVEKSVLAR